MKNTNKLTIFFSLPFYPVRKKTNYYFGHFALGLRDEVYQIFNPAMLKSDFIVSRMPIDKWLYEHGKVVEREVTSSDYSHVHIYGKSENYRTTVFYASIDNNKVEKLKKSFLSFDRDFKNKTVHFDTLTNNCASIVSKFFYNEAWFEKSFFDYLPAVLYKRIIKMWQKAGIDYDIGMIEKSCNDDFFVHKLCVGVNGLPSQAAMQKWILQNSNNQFEDSEKSLLNSLTL